MATASELLSAIDDLGADRTRGGFSRHVLDRAEQELREWFTEQARLRGLQVTTDANANLWAWWGEPGPDAVVTGSHLDSVPGGGAFDGPLGVVSALAALDLLRARGFTPRRPLAVVVFAEEEGGRFGVPCLGSRLLTGTIDPDRARALRDPDGVSFAEAMRSAGMEPERAGRDDAALERIGRFVELHVEQGRGLIDLQRPVGVASSILSHGRWRFRITGQGNHAGATPMGDRRDPMLPSSRLVLAARDAARDVDGARATVGRLVPNPGGTNVVASSVDMWLDARSPADAATRGLVAELSGLAEKYAAEEGCRVEISEESYADTAHFDAGLREELATLLGDAPVLPTGAGHDAGILAAHTPAAMLFVRNPTGVSHAPQEHAEPEDCEAGVTALARTLEHLAGGRPPEHSATSLQRE
ncbi:N-carbamoyl-L-amino-acid hydrolase [Halopolyspora algeriensis]|uniref:N-carbamoyl-L-amino-acid hydrolase n=1 Tax=Halopolyspora algeriensis TaxID=1500506 RepID=A0A368VYM3_9ACTN|nr:allantoate amidohydrolase [Halopolyspora algeriensis]RCW45337.1 N-carbamoyl-L-amino-acid hydrolase [Halopolyspora algeriensis]TQM47377.1 N-carbamoyl-L-amino-acid hydrolase [Halopolyspora algeriensis]